MLSAGRGAGSAFGAAGGVRITIAGQEKGDSPALLATASLETAIHFAG